MAEALSICFQKFTEFFHVDPGDKDFCFVFIINVVQGTKLSLPGIAFTAKYNMFDQALPYVVTFSKSMDQTGFSAGDHIRKLFRNSDGGITNCYHRF